MTGQQAAGKPSSFWRDLRTVWAVRDFRRLLSTRLVSQTGDGIFTAGLGTYVFFNASTFPSPFAGAAAFAVLYAPYSVIGPFAGVFIDRWSRRHILVYSTLLRCAFVVLTAGLMAAGSLGLPLYVAVLLVLGVDRFFQASLSAALPHVVAGDKLVMGNAVSPTAGGTLAAAGGVIGLGVNAAAGNTRAAAAVTLLVAAAFYLCSSMVARTMPKGLLGPHRAPGQRRPLRAELRAVAAGMGDGLRYLARRRGPAAALCATGGSRLLYGILLLMSILLYRNYFYRGQHPATAEAHYGYLVAVAAVGYFCAALVAPPVTRRLGKPAFLALLLALSAVVSGVLGETFRQVAFLVMALFLGLAGQGVAISTVTIMQEELDDSYRGRAFAFYDMAFNIMFAAGALIAAPFLPLSGRSAPLITAVAAGYALVAAGYWLAARHAAPPPVAGGRGGVASPSDAAQRSRS